jgi:hypothetical protein
MPTVLLNLVVLLPVYGLFTLANPEQRRAVYA